MEIVITILLVVLILTIMFSGRGRRSDFTPNPVWSVSPKTYRETLDEIRAKEELEKTHRFVSYWSMYGKRVNKPTLEQLSNPNLVRVEKWVKITPPKQEVDTKGKKL